MLLSVLHTDRPNIKSTGDDSYERDAKSRFRLDGTMKFKIIHHLRTCSHDQRQILGATKSSISTPTSRPFARQRIHTYTHNGPTDTSRPLRQEARAFLQHRCRARPVRSQITKNIPPHHRAHITAHVTLTHGTQFLLSDLKPRTPIRAPYQT